MSKALKNLIVLIVVVILFAAGWYFISPLFINQEVNEEFPRVIPTEEELQAMSEEERTSLERQIVEEMASMPAKEVDEAMMDAADETGDELLEPARIGFGEFRDADSFHRGAGDAGLYMIDEERVVLRLENFNVTNGPDLHVLLAYHEDPNSRDDINEGYVDLGELKGNIGNQNYEVPDSVDLSQIKSVVIYCKPFHVIFSVASLKVSL